ncbi:MAG: hypothetical protein ABI972_27510 [Acidobacteriota bacterium]
MQAGFAPNTPIDDAVARLTRQYKAEGDIELMFIRQIAAAQVTYESLQRAIDTLLAAADLNDLRIDRLSRAKAREQRQQTTALKELKDLQQRRNAIERFPTQTQDFPPLANHADFIGLPSKIKPLLGFRKRNYPDPATLDALLKDLNQPIRRP